LVKGVGQNFPAYFSLGSLHP